MASRKRTRSRKTLTAAERRRESPRSKTRDESIDEPLGTDSSFLAAIKDARCCRHCPLRKK